VLGQFGALTRGHGNELDCRATETSHGGVDGGANGGGELIAVRVLGGGQRELDGDPTAAGGANVVDHAELVKGAK
jgi:hypothetical protein